MLEHPAPATVTSLDQAWSIQIFSTSDPLGFGPARAMMDLALTGEEHHVQESFDGAHHYLIVETRHDPVVMDAVRRSLEAGGVDHRLENVHTPRTFTDLDDDGERAA